MATVHEWLEGARVRTLPASTSPVFAGTGVAWFTMTRTDPPFGDHFSAWTLITPILCLLVALGMQIGSNFSNDYSDGIRGTDAHRVGPMRLVGSGLVAPPVVKRAAWISFGIACLVGLVLVAHATDLFSGSTWKTLFSHPGTVAGQVLVPIVLVLIGAACVLAAWYYTGGKRPYGYAGFGEVFVFIFFGLVAAVGTTFVQAPWTCVDCVGQTGCPPCARDIAWAPALLTGVVMGCLAMAILVANNLRDLDSDHHAGKITLPVRLGDRRTRVLYVCLIIAAALGLIVISALTTWFALLSLLGLMVIVRPLGRVIAGATGRELIHVLKMTGVSELITALLLGVGLGIGWWNA
ncbi:MAG: 1,4-dihydroxy-2-naphthoate octaprenyltransferase [Propionibacteriaceae bacterium]|nr:1,4-dihydroxy-2-naphthoate octaprenyltransferase [Propionibacteriaceae bacterium]